MLFMAWIQGYLNVASSPTDPELAETERQRGQLVVVQIQMLQAVEMPDFLR